MGHTHRGYTLKENETIGRIDHPSGRSYKILELLNTETGVISLEGEQLQPFSSDIIKAIRSGYVLKNCADEVLRGTWQRLAEKNAARQSDLPGDEAGDTPVVAPEAPQQEKSEDPEIGDTPPCVNVDIPERAQHEAPLAPAEALAVVPAEGEAATVVAEEPQPIAGTHLRDRRSPESPASESIRLQIAARDREADRLQATFAHQESYQGSETETAETSASDKGASPEPDMAITVESPVTHVPEAKSVTPIAPEPVKAESKKTHESRPVEPANPFALF